MTGPRPPSSGRLSGPFRSPTSPLPWPVARISCASQTAAGTASTPSAGPAGSRRSWPFRSPTAGPCSTRRDGLRGRTPLTIEWTGGRRPPGDEVAPIDLRIDHVYLVSCKYESDILANASPGRLFDGLLATSGDWDRTDWYESVAPVEFSGAVPGLRLGHRPDRLSAGAVGMQSGPARRPAEGPGRAGLSRCPVRDRPMTRCAGR